MFNFDLPLTLEEQGCMVFWERLEPYLDLDDDRRAEVRKLVIKFITDFAEHVIVLSTDEKEVIN